MRFETPIQYLVDVKTNRIEFLGVRGRLFRRGLGAVSPRVLPDAVFVPEKYLEPVPFDYHEFRRDGWADWNARFCVSGVNVGHGIPNLEMPVSAEDVPDWVAAVNEGLRTFPWSMPVGENAVRLTH